MARIVCIGEAMVELSEGVDRRTFRYGGDAIGTAVHLARLGHDVAFFTAVGEEPASHKLRDEWEKEGVDCSLVLTHPTREVGLYAITSGPQGQRQFSYWRESSAAREMFALEGSVAAAERAAAYDLVCFSLESLAILPPDGRDRLLDLARKTGITGRSCGLDPTRRLPPAMPRLLLPISVCRHGRTRWRCQAP
jgi:2-dehydro-3-deoxygluconokinase